MQEHAYYGKVVLDPTMTKEEALHQRDYYSLARKNVAERRRQDQSFLNKLRLPEPGQLVSEYEPTPAERQKREQEQLQRQLQQQQQQQQKGGFEQYLPGLPGMQPPPAESLLPAREDQPGFVSSIKEALTPSYFKEKGDDEENIPQFWLGHLSLIHFLLMLQSSHREQVELKSGLQVPCLRRLL